MDDDWAYPWNEDEDGSMFVFVEWGEIVEVVVHSVHSYAGVGVGVGVGAGAGAGEDEGRNEVD
jgi:hypothetical protein